MRLWAKKIADKLGSLGLQIDIGFAVKFGSWRIKQVCGSV